MRYELFIAKRHLHARGGLFKKIITWISIVGICIGVAALLIVLSVMNGFRNELQRRILKATPDIMVLQSHHRPITNSKALIKKIEDVEGVVRTSPYIFIKTMIRGKGNRMDGIMVRGEVEPPPVKDKIIWGEYETEEDGIVLGKHLADMLGVFIKDTVTLYGFPYGKSPGLLNLKSRDFIVRGIFDVGLYDFNSSLAYANIVSVQELFSLHNMVTGIEVEVERIDHADRIAERIGERLDHPYYAMSWKELNANLFAALSLERFTMFILLTLIIIVAAFNIVATLLMNVIGKTREIGILLSIGSSPSSIRKIFMFQGLIMGIIGTLSGLGIGWLLCELLSRYQFIKLPAEIYDITTLPVSMQPLDFIIVPLVTISISLLASLYPAFKASKLEPVEAIRYE